MIDLKNNPTKTAIPFLIGTKFDQFATFPRDEQEEITKQVSEVPLITIWCSDQVMIGEAIRPSYACFCRILFHFSFDKRTKNLQDCPSQSL